MSLKSSPINEMMWIATIVHNPIKLLLWEGKENKGADFYCADIKLEFVIFQDTEATSSASRSVTPLDLESQTDENTTPINAAKTIATTCADKDPTKKRVAEDDIGSVRGMDIGN
ncbi:hypothetical protein Tco_1019068 [Tanacetum coccineum]|uniref:Uncharacterized protein n=1 Tax=Tanacetum coccineum TaxID=301880 RepID=A0ABQ5FW46_9ASTR